jgi:hypothetical protein
MSSRGWQPSRVAYRRALMCAARMLTRLPACGHRWHGACGACRLLWTCVVPRAGSGWRGLCPGRVATGSGVSCPFMLASIVRRGLGFMLARLAHSDSLSQLRSQFKTPKKGLFSRFGGVGCVACPRPSAIGHKCKTMPNPWNVLGLGPVAVFGVFFLSRRFRDAPRRRTVAVLHF